MADVVVTRADRVLAIRALGYHPNASAPAWIESGMGGFCGTYDEADRIALSIAKARAEGFAAGREAGVYDARLRISFGDHAGAADKERGE